MSLAWWMGFVVFGFDFCFHHPSCCARLEDTEVRERKKGSWCIISAQFSNVLKWYIKVSALRAAMVIRNWGSSSTSFPYLNRIARSTGRNRLLAVRKTTSAYNCANNNQPIENVRSFFSESSFWFVLSFRPKTQNKPKKLQNFKPTSLFSLWPLVRCSRTGSKQICAICG